VGVVARDPIGHYAKAVVARKVVAGRLVRLACKRHLRDVKEAKPRGLVWKLDRALHAIAFFTDFLTLEDGRAFILQPWQQFIVGSLFGWYTVDGRRRFRTAYIEVGKGNGKTPMAAGMGLYGLVADEEASAEVYAAATAREQARICLEDAKKMVERSPDLLELVDVNVGSLVVRSTGSSFKPVSSEHRALDGRRVHICVLDEVQEHPDAMVVDKMAAGVKGRRNPLIIEITNSGFNRESVAWRHHAYSEQVLVGVEVNESWFGYVCGLDAGDSWQDEKVWLKANPNIGVSITADYLRQQVQEAIGIPAKQNIVRRLNFCEWTEGSTLWIDMAVWDSGAGSVPDSLLVGKPCFAGLDLSNTTDLSALALLWALEDGRYALRLRFWMPEANVQKRVQSDHVPYDVWIRDGFVEATPGNVVDHEVIRRRILEDAARHALKELAFDRYASSWLITQLQQEWGQHGPQVVPFGQGFVSMNSPTKEFETLILSGRLLHGGNPVLRWMMTNVCIAEDPAGNVKPHKGKSVERIDGIPAALMALGRAMLRPSDGDGWHFATFDLPGLGPSRTSDEGFMI
jgi:phage terminase large subunit-like protein